jgi:hypothetical protein
MMRRQTRRGISLTEALIALGIMAIGLIAILSLYPVGAVQMASAFKDDRAGHMAANSSNLLRSFWLDWVKEGTVQARGTFSDTTTTPARVGLYEKEPFFIALDNANKELDPAKTQPKDTTELRDVNPKSTLIAAYPLATATDPTSSSLPGFPVLLDPIGSRVNRGAIGEKWVGTKDKDGTVLTASDLILARRTLNVIDSPSLAAFANALRLKYCTLADDLYFDTAKNGAPDNAGASSTTLEREGKFNLAWLVQRERNDDRLTARMRVLVFQGRPSTDVASDERYYKIDPDSTSTATVGATTLTIIINGNRPPLPKGGWIILCSVPDATTPAMAEPYRVINITQPTDTNKLELELEKPIRGFNNGATLATSFKARVLVLEHLVEVFERNDLTSYPNPEP